MAARVTSADRGHPDLWSHDSGEIPRARTATCSS
jgi:hypothetical protein